MADHASVPGGGSAAGGDGGVPPSPSSSSDAAAEGAPESLLQSVQSLLRELPGLVSDRVELLSLEVTRAGRALAKIVAFLVAAAILAVTAWLALWAGVAGALIAAGLHWAWAALLILVVNLAAAAFALSRLRSLLPMLGLPATRRHLTLSPSTAPPKPRASASTHGLHPSLHPDGEPAGRAAS